MVVVVDGYSVQSQQVSPTVSAKNSSSQKQHYVPEVLLSLYAEGSGKGRLYVFDKHAGQSLPGPMTVKKLCKEGGFYTAEAPHGKVSLEESFQLLEDEYRRIAGKVIQARSLSNLTTREFGALIGFVCVQFLRVPRMRKAFEQMGQLIADKADSVRPQASSHGDFETLLNENELRLRHLEVIAHGAVEGTRILARYAWFMLEADADHPLWLSDCPVVMHNDEKSIYAGLGFAAPGVQIYFPITPKLLLACWHPLVAGRFIEKRQADKSLLGQLKAQYILGLRNNKAALKAEMDKLEKEAKPVADLVAAMRSRGTAAATADNVLHFNWLQFQWSYRFILCSTGNFALASKMLKEHPELKTGMMVTG